jgi:hypothetical protein
MYFVKRGCSVYHILEDIERGAAPAPCGNTLGKREIISLRRGTPPPNIVAEKPADAPLCKHCQKALEADF